MLYPLRESRREGEGSHPLDAFKLRRGRLEPSHRTISRSSPPKVSGLWALRRMPLPASPLCKTAGSEIGASDGGFAPPGGNSSGSGRAHHSISTRISLSESHHC